MTLTTARLHAKDTIRNSGDTTWYTDAYVDRAIQSACTELVNKTNCIRQIDAVGVSEGVYTIGFGFPTGFRADRLRRAYIVAESALERLSFDGLMSKYESETASGEPEQIAFASDSLAAVWPSPDGDYQIQLLWTPFFTEFTAGTSDDATTYLNIPDDILIPALRFGAAWYAQMNQPEQGYVRECKAAWMEHVRFVKGRFGGLGEVVTDKSRLGQ